MKIMSTDEESQRRACHERRVRKITSENYEVRMKGKKKKERFKAHTHT